MSCARVKELTSNDCLVLTYGITLSPSSRVRTFGLFLRCPDRKAAANPHGLVEGGFAVTTASAYYQLEYQLRESS